MNGVPSEDIAATGGPYGSVLDAPFPSGEGFFYDFALGCGLIRRFCRFT